MQRKYDLLLAQLNNRIKNMRGSNKPVLEAHFDMLGELTPDDLEHVLDVYAGLLRINGMSEIIAFQTLIEISRKAAKV